MRKKEEEEETTWVWDSFAEQLLDGGRGSDVKGRGRGDSARVVCSQEKELKGKIRSDLLALSLRRHVLGRLLRTRGLGCLTRDGGVLLRPRHDGFSRRGLLRARGAYQYGKQYGSVRSLTMLRLKSEWGW